jgi:hypothetical protein
LLSELYSPLWSIGSACAIYQQVAKDKVGTEQGTLARDHLVQDCAALAKPRAVARTAGKSINPTAGSGGDNTAGSGGDNTAGSGGDNTAGSGGDNTAGSGGDNTAGSGGDNTAGSGGDNTAGSGGDNTAGSGGDNTAGSGGDNTAGSGGDNTAGGKGLLLRGAPRAEAALLGAAPAVSATQPEAIAIMGAGLSFDTKALPRGIAPLRLPIGTQQETSSLVFLDSCWGSRLAKETYAAAFRVGNGAPAAHPAAAPKHIGLAVFANPEPENFRLVRYGKLGASDYLALPFLIAIGKTPECQAAGSRGSPACVMGEELIRHITVEGLEAPVEGKPYHRQFTVDYEVIDGL